MKSRKVIARVVMKIIITRTTNPRRPALMKLPKEFRELAKPGGICEYDQAEANIRE